MSQKVDDGIGNKMRALVQIGMSVGRWPNQRGPEVVVGLVTKAKGMPSIQVEVLVLGMEAAELVLEPRMEKEDQQGRHQS